MRLLCVPDLEPGNGIGHLSRMLALAAAAEQSGHHVRVFSGGNSARIMESFPHTSPDLLLDALGPANEDGERWTWILVDKRSMDAAELETLAAHGTVIGIDTTGPLSERVPFIVDMLPRARVSKRAASNVTRPDFLFASKQREPLPPSPRRVLFSFGGEDPSNLHRLVLETRLTFEQIFPDAHFSLLRGPLMKEISIPHVASPRWSVVGPSKDMSTLLGDFDTIIGSFGLTMMEAVASGLRAISLEPSRYHASLAAKAGIPSIGTRRIAARKLRGISTRHEWLEPKRQAGEAGGSGAFVAYLETMNAETRFQCPSCGSPKIAVEFRLKDRSISRCSSCGMLSMQLWESQTIDYGEQYFFDDYKKQYGRTYIEDFDHIKGLGIKRAETIRNLVGKPGPRLLDIGCAFGPFLAAASDQGFEVQGLDINLEATTYVSQTLNLPAKAGNILEMDVGDWHESFDCITLWFVIEHFTRLEPLLGKIWKMLRPGGVLAFSTPSAQGISARKSAQDFFARSPRDHYTLWEPSRVSKILRLHGFELAGIQSTGHHPERFPGVLSSTLLRGPVAAMSRTMNLGDTFEAYARKLSK